MQFFRAFTTILLAGSALVPTAAASAVTRQQRATSATKIAPQVFIISMFQDEAEVWWNIPEFDILAHNITIPGASPLFPSVHCTPDHSICQLITGEGDINAAVTATAVLFSSLFDLTQTYFLIAGIAGINPKVASTCSVTFARFAVQVALQYEIDIRELPPTFSTGYIPQGSTNASQYPGTLYGTELFEVNDNLRSIAADFARKATLADSPTAQAYRAHYATSNTNNTYNYTAATQPPSIVTCDVTTSDVYFSGTLLSTAFENTTALLTNNTGTYCATAQEDNATLEALLRAASTNPPLADFSRVIIMRSASDFDRPYPGQSATDNLLYADQGAFEPAVENLYRAGVEIVMGIVGDWEGVFEGGVRAGNYVGDAWGTLGGREKRDIGPGRRKR